MISQKDRTGALFAQVIETFTRKQHRETFEVIMNLFLTGRGQPLPQRATVKSPSAISRFLNHYQWNVRHIIRIMRQHVITEFQRYRQTPKGRSCKVELIVDMTSLPKEGRCRRGPRRPISGAGSLLSVSPGHEFGDPRIRQQSRLRTLLANSKTATRNGKWSLLGLEKYWG